MARIYDKELKCGCLLSKDGAGGIMPCYAEFGNMDDPKDRAAFDLHLKSWADFELSEEYKDYFPAAFDKDEPFTEEDMNDE